ncbi:UvrD-helicase domain-containing protein, partial [Vulcaniibacterium thermophilum]
MHGLNPPQQAAVLHCDGPLLVLAGAGSGKTRVIVEKIAHLIGRGIMPARRIAAITFTN